MNALQTENNMVMENPHLLVVAIMMANGRMEQHMVMENLHGMMDMVMKVNQ